MGFLTNSYSKILRIGRELAHDFLSVRQYLTGSVVRVTITIDGKSTDVQLSELSNEDLQTLVINRAIEWSFKNGLLKTLSDLCENSRLNGANVRIHIRTETWESLVFLVERVKQWRRLNESELIEHCLREYIEEIKRRRCLP